MTLALAPKTDLGAPIVRHPTDASRRVRAVLFDLDGTLYRQAPVRRRMALELMTMAVSAPRLAASRWRALSAYRRAQEHLRRDGAVVSEASQIAPAAEESGLTRADVERLVNEWMHRRPLRHLRRCRAAGIDELLAFLDGAGVPAGVFSDYRGAEKLEALGLAGRFAFVMCATDPDVGRFKPHPRGFLRACERWGLPPRDVLMVGDRVDVDGAGASAAGMPSVIVGRPTPQSAAHDCFYVPSLDRLRRVLDDRR
jgi:HAD superfamily hydrolase (TIGR01549 family)